MAIENNSFSTMTEDEDDIEIGLSFKLDMFKESNEVVKMILDIPNSAKEESLIEKNYEKLREILNQYQEQPHLLDPHLQNLLNKLLSIILDESFTKEAVSLAFQYLWLVVKVRGYKVVVRKMPHEVKDLIPVLSLLEKEDFENDFYGSYILLMWLSIIVYMPFSISSFDASMEKSLANLTSVEERIMIVIKKHLKCAQSSREMAAYLASRFVTRPDSREKLLMPFINYSFEILKNNDSNAHSTLFHKMGVLRALGLIFKHGRREELVDYASEVLKKVIEIEAELKDTPLRKFSMKLIQRIGLTFLQPKLASWRYKRGNRSLLFNIGGTIQKSDTEEGHDGEKISYDGDGDDDFVPEGVEEVIDYLLQGLKDQDTVVRWSAAKGIGRVTERLPQSLGDDVLGEILQLFSLRESDKSWHGGCLALAELARRGLLLPARLNEVMPILEKALVYDELRGQCSVGSNIRDAACYLCWAFARAYHPDQLVEFVEKIAKGLLIVSLFDREIPCRRAGSAAFQEHVGRQGNFPHGIEILTNVDYFAVGIRSNAYLSLSVKVAQYPQYTTALIDHLVLKKINHWDSSIRELAAKALQILTPFAPEYVGKEILPKLLDMCTGTVLLERHGAILATGHILHGLYTKAKSMEDVTLESYLEREVLTKTLDIAPTLDKCKLYKGMSGEYMRQATSVLIEKCCLSEVNLEGNLNLIQLWHDLLEDCVLNFEDEIRNQALIALSALWSYYFEENSEDKVKWRNSIIQKYVQGVRCGREIQCLGYAALLGYLPNHFIDGHFFLILEALIKTSTITFSTLKWALARKQAVDSILNLITKSNFFDSLKEVESMHDSLTKVYEALLNALEDYTMDRRGDIGAWVREAAIHALQVITEMCLTRKGTEYFASNPEIVREMMSKVSQQSVERIDRTRKVAGHTFGTLLHSTLPNIPNAEELTTLFPRTWCVDCNWAAESVTFFKFVELLDLSVYRPRILLGLTYSLGGVSANLSRYTLEALQNYLNQRMDDKEQLLGFVETILELFQQHQREDRITLPLIKSLSDILGSCSALDELLEEEETLMPQFLSCLKSECFKCTDFHKLSATVTTLCELLRIHSSCTKAIITQLIIFLGYQYPKVRALTATSFLTSLMEYSENEIVPESKLEEITSVLEDTPWMDSLELAREERNKLCTLLEVPIPKPKKKADQKE